MAINDLENKVKNIINLPSLPSTTLEIIKMTDDFNISVQSLSEVILKDQTVASKLIKVANSPYFSYSKSISTVDFAITVLGLKTVKEIVLSASYIGNFKNYKSSIFNTKAFWDHSIISTIICRELSKVIKYPLIEESFVAGLIHDLGIFIMSQFFEKEFKILITEMEKGEKDILSLEEEIYGANHALVGSWLLEKWNFPAHLVEAIQCHHNPSAASNDNKKLSALIYYTEYLTITHGPSVFDLEKTLPFTPKHLNIFSFSKMEQIDNVFLGHQERIGKEFENMSVFFS